MAIRWLSSMEVGVDVIDDQHKSLVEKVNKLLEACEKMDNNQEVAETMEFLQDYVVSHFDTEKELMKKYDYPETEEHLAIHKDFVETFLGFKKRFETEGITTKFVTDFNQTMVDWLLQHIAEVDSKLGEFLEEEM